MSKVTENPRGTCVLGGINEVLGAIKGTCPIYHSGPGCCMQTAAGEAGQSGCKSPAFVSGVSVPSSNMLEREVVFGGVDKLRTTIQGTVDIIDAEVFFILTGCTAGIIGDDIESIADEFIEQGIRVYPIDTPGFAGDSNLGYEVVWNSLLKNVVKRDLPRQKNLVNIHGIIPYHDPFWSGNLEEISRILRKLGLEVNTFFTENQGIREVENSSAAALNIILNPWLFKGPAETYEREFGVPYLRYAGMPIGATDTTEFVRQVACALQLDSELVERVIAEEEAYVYHYLEQAIGELSWKRFAVVGDANMVIGLTRYLANDYSFTPLLAIVTDPMFRPADKERIEGRIKDLEYAKAPEVLFLTDQYEITKALEENEDITLLIGSTNEREIGMRKDIQCSVISFPITDRLIFNRTYAGYRGSLTLIEDLYDNL